MKETKSQETIENQIREIVAKVLETELDSVQQDARLVEDLGADSMLILEIMVALDKRFGIEIAETELPNMTSLKRLSKIVFSHIKP